VGSIQKIDRPKPWRVRFRGSDGREHSRSFRRKVDAERWLREEESKLDRGLWLDPAVGKVSLRTYASAWMAGRTLKPKTRGGYESLLNSRILPVFGEVELIRITRDGVRAWVAGMIDEGLSASRVKQARALLAEILGQAVDDGVLGRNPAARISTPQKRPRRQRYLMPDQVERLAEACERRQKTAGTLVRFLAWSGLRWGEAVALRWENVNVARRRVRVRESATEVGGKLIFGEPKTHEHRTVVVPRFVFDGLPPGEGLVFTAPRGGPLRTSNFRRNVWLSAVTECGLGDLVVHDLRDTAASQAIASGASVKAVQRMLGHASAAMTLDVYGGLYDDDLEDLADRLEARWAAQRGTEGAQIASLRSAGSAN
jgi:integrase